MSQSNPEKDKKPTEEVNNKDDGPAPKPHTAALEVEDENEEDNASEKGRLAKAADYVSQKAKEGWHGTKNELKGMEQKINDAELKSLQPTDNPNIFADALKAGVTIAVGEGLNVASKAVRLTMWAAEGIYGQATKQTLKVGLDDDSDPSVEQDKEDSLSIRPK